ncbi:septin-2-like [Cynoglossus semilaevis]|uniref:septin-2-like n=1 Tax=Cynoglossus semilaevis TaxID=244447 RepID=UPI000D625F94|nr:septin-2-like [Cynoglossus semilaevis]
MVGLGQVMFLMGDFKGDCHQRASIPFAVIGSNQLIEVKGKKICCRLYPWGVVEVGNPEHNDFLKLRTMLVTHMQDLQEVTQDLHYENLRSERLKRAGRAADEEVFNKDQILLQKELEVKIIQSSFSLHCIPTHSKRMSPKLSRLQNTSTPWERWEGS